MTVDPASGLLPHFRMPTVLGPAPGPRNMPADRAHMLYDGQMHLISLKAAANPAVLAGIIPAGCTIRDGLMEVQVIQLLNLGWLAGRGYNIVAVRVPVSRAGRDFTFSPVLWESEADPVLTGREELGSPKLYAQIPTPRRLRDGYAGHAAWDGFRFFDFAVEGLAPVDGPPPASAPNMLLKYFPRTGDWATPDVAQLTLAVAGEHPAPRLLSHEAGIGRYTFTPARWEDMPTQFSFVNALAAVGAGREASATVTLTDGITDLRAQRVLEDVKDAWTGLADVPGTTVVDPSQPAVLEPSGAE